MLENEKNERKPTSLNKRDPKQIYVRSYSLETIMALQKALEGGISPEEEPAKSKARGAEREPVIARHIRSRLITPLRNSLAKLGDGLVQLLQPAVGFKKRSKQTSAR